MKKSPRETAWLPSKLFFCWLWSLLHLGSKRALEIDDLYRVLPEDRSAKLGNTLQEAWNQELRAANVRFQKWDDLEGARLQGSGDEERMKRRARFGRALLRVFGFDYLVLGLIAFLDECVIKILQPILLGYLIRYFGGEFTVTEGYLYAAGVILCSAWYVTQHHPFFFGLQHIGMRSRVAVSSVVYRKALKLSVSALRHTTIGQMVNFLSNDMTRFDEAPLMAWYLVIAPLQLLIVVYVLWGYYSYICLVGVGFLILFVPFQSLMGHLFGRMRLTVAGRTDKRIRIMNEILSAIRVIKMYTWEDSFANLVREARADEVRALRTVSILKAMNFSVYYVSSKIVVFLTLLTYVLTGNFLTSEQVFVTLALYNNVRNVLTLFFPYGMSTMAELLISIRRLENFLLLEERDDIHSAQKLIAKEREEYSWRSGPRSSSIGLSVRNLRAKWCPESEEWTLDNVSLQVRRGQLIGVIGTVGSSKSSLLQAILGELPSLGGKIECSGRLAYAAQEPWIFSGTLRENILFGKPFESTWYEKVIEACALRTDLDLLPYGDSSLVGDRGISLSGGQKARVSLARAVYSDRDIYLLDDPLSAVDAEVGKHLFEKCIRGILRKKGVILVTHQLQFLKPADEILILNQGRVEAQGSYVKLQQSGFDLAQLLQSEDSPPTTTHFTTSTPTASPLPKGGLRRISSDTGLSTSRLPSIEMQTVGDYGAPLTQFQDEEDLSFSTSFSSSHRLINSPTPNGEGSSLKKRYGTFGGKEAEEQTVGGDDGGGPMVNEERRSSGTISIGLYWKYIRAGSSAYSFSFLTFTALLTQVFLTGSDYWLQFWTQIEEERILRNGSFPVERPAEVDPAGESWLSVVGNSILTDRNVQIGIYSGMIGSLFIISICRNLTFNFICLRASVSLHRRLFGGVIRSPMLFFERNPVGRILNRFARDVGVIDEYLPHSLFDTWEIPFQGIGILVVVSLMSPILIIPAIFLLLIFYKLRKYYLQTARSLKRLESITRSPVFTLLSSSFHGLTTIRALNVEREFCRQFDEFQDQHSSCWYLFLATSRWVGITLDWIAILYVTTVTFSFMGSDLDGSQVGLALTSALTLTGLFQWGVRQSAEAENHMVSVERVLEYSELEPEPPLESSPGQKPPSDWPARGEIRIHNLFLRYGEEEPVLKDISLGIKSMEKVGIVGRTGAGKSSIISSLFRMVEPYRGGIEIDGRDILSVGLHDLRSQISIIPQDPVLFLGSLRRNLDPFNEFSDPELWNVLEDAHLKESILEMVPGLESPISEGGTNFSVGERQLICLARAILRNNKILVLDEATANVDPKTDGLIQATIRTKFRACTVLTVAHRLHTVMDSDRILVLDAGRVVEFDVPWTLLQNEEGALFQLTRQTGTPTAEALIRVAKDAFERRGNEGPSAAPLIQF